MEVLTKISEIKDFHGRHAGKKLGFVPTMGALHPGHISLIAKARSENDFVLASVFVNPAQFNDPSDLEKYPRTPDQDIAMLKDAGCDMLFMPSVDEIYPKNEKTEFNMDFGFLAETMEGRHRPGHFNGMARVVHILFNIVKANNAYFGEKDFQQLAIVKVLAARLHPQLTIVPCETVREKDGLAMSSRNMLLSSAERTEAVVISEVLNYMKLNPGKKNVKALLEDAWDMLTRHGMINPDYVELVDSDTLQPVKDWNSSKKIRACIAVRLGKVRLIDNMEIRGVSIL